MGSIQSVGILGAGAVGAYFAKSFFDSSDFSTFLIAKGYRFEKLRSNGLVINAKHYPVQVLNPDDAETQLDLLIVTLKHHHLDDAVRDLDHIIGENTTIISFMNGLDSEEFIGSIYGMDKVLYGISVGIDALRDGNQITYTKPGKHFFGKTENSSLSEQVLAVQDAFEKAGITYETPQDMIRILWWKFMVNVGINQASAVMRAPYGVFQTDPQAQALMKALMVEVIDLAEVLDVDLTQKDIDDWYAFLHTLSSHGKTSMLQDIEAGRKTEVEIFGGKMVELGKMHGISTPVNQTMLRIIRVLEQKPPED